MLTIVAEVTAKPGCEERLREELLRCVEPTRAEEGCVQYLLHVSADRPGHFLFYENWASREAFDQHMATPYLRRLVSLIPELVEGEPRIATFERIA